MEWNSWTFSRQDAITETSLSFQKLRALLHSDRSCGLATRAAEAQPKLWPRSDPQTNGPAAKKIPEEPRYWRHQGKMGPGRLRGQPSLVQVMACQLWWGGAWGTHGSGQSDEIPPVRELALSPGGMLVFVICRVENCICCYEKTDCACSWLYRAPVK